MAKFVLALCASALFVQAISGQCLGSRSEIRSAPAIKPTGCGAGGAVNSGINLAAPAAVQIAARPAAALPAAGALLLASTSGGAFPTSSASPLAPSGLSVQSELLIEGPIAVWGEMPFVSAVAFDSQLPSSGFAIADYSCGDGNIGITSESAAPAYDNYSYGAPAYAAPAASGYAASAYAAPAYTASALSPAVGIAAAPARASAVEFVGAPWLAAGPAISQKSCGCQ